MGDKSLVAKPLYERIIVVLFPKDRLLILLNSIRFIIKELTRNN